ncbi:MAG: CDP-alcohol phosphatidyltransferase family protein [Desulfobulbaceae bacterium]|nr:MAG: CDP-alcohol phosphatidyltransferase family protein [Desulfobulbaceae bacterium]
MLDHLSLKMISPVLKKMATVLHRAGVHPDAVSVIGFLIGMAGAGMIAGQFYLVGLILILGNRLADGLDGAIARLAGTTDSGAYLDICLDFIFYSAVVLGFAFADPGRNSLPAALLIFSFIGTGSSFLAFAILAQKNNISDLRLPGKGFYYLGGLAEGTETIGVFILFCLFPYHFPLIALSFAIICLVSTVLRVIHGYRRLKS